MFMDPTTEYLLNLKKCYIVQLCALVLIASTKVSMNIIFVLCMIFINDFFPTSYIYSCK